MHARRVCVRRGGCEGGCVQRLWVRKEPVHVTGLRGRNGRARGVRRACMHKDYECVTGSRGCNGRGDSNQAGRAVRRAGARAVVGPRSKQADVGSAGRRVSRSVHSKWASDLGAARARAAEVGGASSKSGAGRRTRGRSKWVGVHSKCESRVHRPMVRRVYQPNPPTHCSDWVMWVGNVPREAEHAEL
ncbi:hypothetical protein B0H14DRAFT_3048358, partial [Mycena olivaceomarginata]